MANSSSPKNALFAAVSKILRPLVRTLLRHGVPYKAFADLAKSAYLDVAMNEFQVPGKKQTNSRVATITGLSRKDVQRLLKEEKLGEDKDRVVRYHRAARVVYGWVHDKRFNSSNGETLQLPFEGEAVSFTALVKSYSGDVPPRAILDELLQVGVVDRNDDGNIELLARAYIPQANRAHDSQASEEEMMNLLGRDVAGLLSTMDKNIHAVGAPFFQRKVFYDNMPEEATEKLQVLMADKGQKFLEFFDEWMSKHDRDSNPNVNGSGKKAAGIGLYYFEEEVLQEKR